MKQDFESVKTITLAQKKDYLLTICQDKQLQDKIIECMSDKKLNDLMKQISIQFYTYACHALYNTKNYEQLEYHLMMMNEFFHCQNYQKIKENLLIKLLQKPITINEYCVIRHLISFNKHSFSYIIGKLHDDYHVDSEECAKICLLEDQYTLASFYLRQLDECNNEQLLDLLCSYSLYEYVSLMKYYRRKKKGYQLVMSH